VTIWATIASLGTSLTIGLLARVLATGSIRLCRTFPFYLAAVCIPDLAFLLDPASFTWGAWLAKESLQVALKLALALELSELAFARLPRARRAARTALGSIALITLILVVRTFPGPEPASIARVTFPWLNEATAVTYCAIIALCLFYRVPMHPYHRAILRGLTLYLFFSTFAIHGLDFLGREVAGDAQSLAYGILTMFWLTATWTPSGAIPARPATIQELRPWA